MNKAAQKKEQEDKQCCWGMRDLFKDPEKIGEAVYKREYEDKKDYAFLQSDHGQDQNSQQDREEEKLKWLDQWDILHIEEVE